MRAARLIFTSHNYFDPNLRRSLIEIFRMSMLRVLEKVDQKFAVTPFNSDVGRTHAQLQA